MFFEKYTFSEQNGWSFPEVRFSRINLIVGDSGTGKTRFINVITNLAKQTISDSVKYEGNWRIDFSVKNKKYQWKLVVNSDQLSDEKYIQSEELNLLNNDEVINLVKRDNDAFYFKDQKLPKLSKTVTSISLLKDESDISDIYEEFRAIVTRRFFTDELAENFRFYAIPKDLLSKLAAKKNLKDILRENIGFQNKIFLLKECFPKKYDELIIFFKKTFPFITDFTFLELSRLNKNLALPLNTNAFCFKEKYIDKWVTVNDISSGMQKVFLIALDIFLLSDGGIILIDEYENSLGINAINFFPELISTSESDCQYIISSHHPYLINNIPIDNWLVFHRKGFSVNIKSGLLFKDKFGKSKQQHFIQLINDPFYTEGIE
jgi:predicted ATPase